MSRWRITEYGKIPARQFRVSETALALHHAIGKGLRASEFEGVGNVIGATRDAAAADRRSVVPDSTWKRRKGKGKSLSPSESDQTARLARITAFALDV
jgi:uncharacterized protein (DUF2384 family)